MHMCVMCACVMCMILSLPYCCLQMTIPVSHVFLVVGGGDLSTASWVVNLLRRHTQICPHNRVLTYSTMRHRFQEIQKCFFFGLVGCMAMHSRY